MRRFDPIMYDLIIVMEAETNDCAEYVRVGRGSGKGIKDPA